MLEPGLVDTVEEPQAAIGLVGLLVLLGVGGTLDLGGATDTNVLRSSTAAMAVTVSPSSTITLSNCIERFPSAERPKSSFRRLPSRTGASFSRDARAATIERPSFGPAPFARRTCSKFSLRRIVTSFSSVVGASCLSGRGVFSLIVTFSVEKVTCMVENDVPSEAGGASGCTALALSAWVSISCEFSGRFGRWPTKSVAFRSSAIWASTCDCVSMAPESGAPV